MRSNSAEVKRNSLHLNILRLLRVFHAGNANMPERNQEEDMKKVGRMTQSAIELLKWLPDAHRLLEITICYQLGELNLKKY